MIKGLIAPSEEELEELGGGGDWVVLGEDEYIATIMAVDEKLGMTNKFPSKNDSGPTHDMIQPTLSIDSFADGEDLVDEKGEIVDFALGPVLSKPLLNPKKIGMVPQPAKTRKFLAAALGQNIGDRIELGDWQELVGKKVIVSIKPDNGYNNAIDFRPLKKQRVRATTPKGPVEGDELKRRIVAVTDADAPDNVSSLPAAAKNEEDLEF